MPDRKIDDAELAKISGAGDPVDVGPADPPPGKRTDDDDGSDKTGSAHDQPDGDSSPTGPVDFGQ